jgi:hypothetical protein
MYEIRNNSDNSFAWSNKFGWVDDDEYDLFTEKEKNELNLPINGRWVCKGEN